MAASSVAKKSSTSRRRNGVAADAEQPNAEALPLAVSLAPVVILPIDCIQPVAWNPNVEDVGTFNALVEGIKKHGLVEPIVVCPIDCSVEEALLDPPAHSYSCVGGEHRWKGAKVAGMTEVTAALVQLSEDEQMALNVQLNTLHGKLDPAKFSELWTKLERKYGYAAAMRLVGMAHNEKQLQNLLKQVARQLPADMREELMKRRDKIRNVEDLAAVVQSLYARYGATLKQSYAFFTYGGRIQLMVRLDDATMKLLKGALEALGERDANEIVAAALRQVAGGVA